MTIKIFDTKSTIISKNKASINWKNHNFIHEESSEIVSEKIDELKNKFNDILLLTSDFNELYKKLRDREFDNFIIFSEYENLNTSIRNENKVKRITNQFESINIEKKFDLIVCNLCLHRINDVIKFSKTLKKMLKKGGGLVCSYFGGKTLIELRDSLIKTEQTISNRTYQRVIPYIDMIDAANLFIKAGFSEVVSDKITFKVNYKNLLKLLKDIKGVGENGCMIGRKKGLMTKNFLEILEQFYTKNYQCENKKIFATCEIITITMWNEGTQQ